MVFQKNEEIELWIDDLGNDGEGIGHIDGYALFVKGALPGEHVRVSIMKAKKNYGFARLVEIIKPSKQRVEPLCSVARQCGGCTLQHLSYEGQLHFKQKRVLDCLERIGGVDLSAVEVEPIMGMEDPWHYRNKAQFPVRQGRDGKPVVGFYAGRTHTVIPVTDCFIQDRSMKGILERLLVFMEEEKVSAYDEERCRGQIRHIFIRRGFATGEIMVCLVVNEGAEQFVKKYREALVRMFGGFDGVVSIQVNENRKRTNVIMGEKYVTVWGKEYIEDQIGDVRYLISAASFYQVNPKQTVKLYEKVKEFAGLKDGDVLWDLYCGSGTISLFLANGVGEKGKVFGVEIVEQAVRDAEQNAELNGIKNARFFCGAAEDVVKMEGLGELVGEGGDLADVVVVDPPRKGCDEGLLKTIGEMGAEKVVYVSCDPATLGRDVKVMEGLGYGVRRVGIIDMFPGGGHVETVCLLSRKVQ